MMSAESQRGPALLPSVSVPSVTETTNVADAATQLRLLCLIPSIPLGGMERAALSVCHHLAGKGAYVHALSARRWGTAVRTELDRLGIGYTDVALPAHFGRPNTLLHARTMVVSAVVTGYEFAGAHRRHRANALLATNSNVAFFARRIARRADTVSVFRIPNPPPTRMGAGLKMRLDRAIWSAIGDSFDHLVCNAHYTAGLVAEASGRPDKVRVVRNYPPCADRRIETPAPELDPTRQHVIYLGQIAHHKGIDVLLEAATKVCAYRPDVDFVLAGPQIWLDDYKARLTEKVAVTGLIERFRLVGNIDDVHGLLTQGSVHVCPSLSPGDSFPNVLLDAKRAGLASVVLPTAGLPEAIENGVDGLVTPDHSADALTSALTGLLDDPKRAAAMGAAAKASLEVRFNTVALTQIWIDLFSGIDAPLGTAFDPHLAGQPFNPSLHATAQTPAHGFA